MTRGPRPEFFAPDVETAQAFGKVPRNIRHSDAAPTTIGIGQVVEQFRRGSGERHLQMKRE